MISEGGRGQRWEPVLSSNPHASSISAITTPKAITQIKKQRTREAGRGSLLDDYQSKERYIRRNTLPFSFVNLWTDALTFCVCIQTLV